MADGLKRVGDDGFGREVLEAEVPVLVEFTARWCPPCRALAPVLEGLAAAHEGRLKVVAVDVDESQATAERWGVRSLPTTLLFRGGRVVQQLVGAVPRAKLESVVAGVL